MKIIDLLNLCRTPLEVLQHAGVKINDINHIDLYNQYLQMTAAGYKTTYIIATLSEQHHISERKIYTLVKQFSADCNTLISCGGGKYQPTHLSLTTRLKTHCTPHAAA